VSATEIIEQFKALPASERAQVARFVVENDDSWIPESFKQGMADADAGRFGYRAQRAVFKSRAA
jgi:predicted transcriptional regulator